MVAFDDDRTAWLLLVGPHDDRAPDRDVYEALYRLVGHRPPDQTARTKPPCCDDQDAAPLLGAAIDDLARRAQALSGSTPRPRR